jgi:hypothetical protein
LGPEGKPETARPPFTLAHQAAKPAGPGDPFHDVEQPACFHSNQFIYPPNHRSPPLAKGFTFFAFGFERFVNVTTIYK